METVGGRWLVACRLRFFGAYMKFYVKSHDFEVVIGGPHISNAMEAGCEAFITHYKDGITLSPSTIISQRGFDYMIHNYSEDEILNTCEILKKAGLLS